MTSMRLHWIFSLIILKLAQNIVIGIEIQSKFIPVKLKRQFMTQKVGSGDSLDSAEGIDSILEAISTSHIARALQYAGASYEYIQAEFSDHPVVRDS